ncbi:MAG TPA: hypothetical protein VFA83_10905 [Acidimicrobiales bacterium]|nr:hypothetical protein [Acidimicrobiales bacterium]
MEMMARVMAEVSAQELEGFGLGSTATSARPGSGNVLVIESCNSTWLFDHDKARFRRVPRGTPLDLPAPEAEWQRFHRLEVDPDTDAFLVHLNESGSRLLRSFRHTPPCQQCEPHGTVELSLEAIRQGPGDD